MHAQAGFAGSAGSKRAGGTGHTQDELAQMDPKRAKRVMANRQVRRPCKPWQGCARVCAVGALHAWHDYVKSICMYVALQARDQCVENDILSGNPFHHCQ